MSTRGVFGFRIDETDKLAYASCDAGPIILGKEILSYISKNSLENMIKRSRELKLVEKELPFDFDNEILGKRDVTEIVDARSYLYNRQCEWAYIINLDSSKLEVHSARERLDYNPQGRYVVKTNPPQYNGAALIYEAPFSTIHLHSIDHHIKNIRTASDARFYLTVSLRKLEKEYVTEERVLVSNEPWFKRFLKLF